MRLADGLTWLIDHLNLDLPHEETERLRQCLRAWCETSAVPMTREIYLAASPVERAARRQALTDEASRLQSELEGEFSLEHTQFERLVRLAGVLIDRHVVRGMCDIGRLSEWRSDSYRRLVTTGNAR